MHHLILSLTSRYALVIFVFYLSFSVNHAICTESCFIQHGGKKYSVRPALGIILPCPDDDNHGRIKTTNNPIESRNVAVP
jgi:hypothetical protein